MSSTFSLVALYLGGSIFLVIWKSLSKCLPHKKGAKTGD